jgi:hypothetical protein
MLLQKSLVGGGGNNDIPADAASLTILADVTASSRAAARRGSETSFVKQAGLKGATSNVWFPCGGEQAICSATVPHGDAPCN